jgi:imidazolonepropionase-like amidohydrolase
MKTLVKTKLLISCTGAPPVEKGWFILENGRIIRVGVSGEACPVTDSLLDYSGYYVMPGMIDGHVHFGLSHSDTIDPMTVLDQLREPGPRKISKAIMYVREHLEAGVTTVRDMGEDDFIDFDLKNAIDRGYFPGPRISPAGAFISPTHGHGQTGQTISDGTEEVRHNCRVNLARGADLLKVFGSGGVVTGKTGVNYCSTTFDELRVAVEEAEAMEKYVAAHVHGGPGIDLCIDAGVQSLEHATLCTDAQIDRIAQAGIWVTITFCPIMHPSGLHDLDKEKQARLDYCRARYIDVIKKMLDKNVRICMGTDGVHGAVWFEAVQMEKCGVPKMRCIEMITREAAESCHMGKDIGAIEAGRYGDFIVLSKNPLENLENLRALSAVYIGGECKHRV